MTGASEARVTQADRDAAAKCHAKSCYEIVRIQGVQCRNGYADGDYLVQAFARHRQSATAPLLAALEQAGEALELLFAPIDRASREMQASGFVMDEHADNVMGKARAARATITAALAKHKGAGDEA